MLHAAKDSNQAYKIYIILSQTGTILSRLLKIITKAPYNHVSISLEKDLHTMYSFGRIHPYNPVIGGFVEETPKAGTFGRFKQTEVTVIELSVNEEQYNQIFTRLNNMYKERHKYHYNYLGLFLAALHIQKVVKNSYYCSEFVKDVLISSKVTDINQFESIPQPIHFLRLSSGNIIYRGRLWDYTPELTAQ